MLNILVSETGLPTRLVSQIQDFAKRESGPRTLAFEEKNLVKIIRASL